MCLPIWGGMENGVMSGGGRRCGPPPRAPEKARCSRPCANPPRPRHPQQPSNASQASPGRGQADKSSGIRGCSQMRTLPLPTTRLSFLAPPSPLARSAARKSLHTRAARANSSWGSRPSIAPRASPERAWMGGGSGGAGSPCGRPPPPAVDCAASPDRPPRQAARPGRRSIRGGDVMGAGSSAWVPVRPRREGPGRGEASGLASVRRPSAGGVRVAFDTPGEAKGAV